MEPEIPIHDPRLPAAAAELRLLPLLSTYLSFPENGTEMFLSPNTIKSQAMSIYRKLGASTRRQAVTRAREVGLAEGLHSADQDLRFRLTPGLSAAFEFSRR